MSNLAVKLIPSNVLIPRDYQIEATNNCLEAFKSADRGQISLPCGAGKTLVSVNIFDKLQPKITLMLSPSLALLRQTLNYFKTNSSEDFSYICVCSDNDIDKNDEDALTEDIISNVISAPLEIRNFFKIKTQRIMFSTYQSLWLIAEAMLETDLEIDLAICDEAHKTAGMNKTMFGLIHDQSKIKVKKRLYMTATPRVWGKNVGKKKKDDDSYLADMNDESIFGKTFFKMSHKDAIERGILVDYQIVAIGISNIQIENYINEHPFLNKGMIKNDIAYVLGLVTAIKNHNLKHVVTYHSTVARAQAFNKLLNMVAPEIDSFHVNGKMPSKDRAKILNEFAKSELSVITNSKCLTEGIDVPGIDAVFFCDPRNSTVDIVQAVGRALRIKPGKTKGSIIIPVFHLSEGVVEDAIAESDFSNLCGVIEALGTTDDRMFDFITDMKCGLGNKSRNYEMLLGMTGAIHTENLTDKIQEHILLSIWERVRVPFTSFEEARAYVLSLGLKSNIEWKVYCKSGQKPKNIPSNPELIYKDVGWEGWKHFLGNDYLPFEEAHAFTLSLRLKNQKEWKRYAACGKRPKNIPSDPYQVYKDKGWKGWKHFLGNDYLPFEEAHAFTLSLRLKNRIEWKRYAASGKKPKNIPSSPEKVFKDVGWEGWGHWLGTGNQRGGYNPRKV